MRKWNIKQPSKSVIAELMKTGGLTSLASSVLASRGHSSMNSVMEKFEVNELSDPFLIKDMDKATEKINLAIDGFLKICIYGDYDCDGIMSTVMLYTFLCEIGADVVYYIPERSEGYGLNADAIRKLSADGVDLIITVDNGISAIKEAELIYELGMSLIVTDHHQPGEELPKAEAIVNPHRKDCFSPFKYLCGAGVVLKLISALDGGDYTMALEQFADLASIATVADIVDLSGENRFIVETGMRLIENTERPGLIALLEISGLLNKKINSSSLGFMIAPRINASGRFGSPKTAVQLLLCEDEEEATSIARELNSLNIQRKETEEHITSEIHKKVSENNSLTAKRVLFFCGKDWSHGVIGIVASRIQDFYEKPCFIMSEINGEIRGSARSFGDFSIYKALEYCKDCLEKFGGHHGAGGFTVKNGKLEEFDARLQEYALINHKIMPVLSYDIDYAVSPEELTIDNINGIKILEPFGAGNESPLFMINNAQIEKISPISAGKHSKLQVSYGNKLVDIVIFRCSPEETGLMRGDICNFAVRLDINEYNNKEYISIIAVDYRKKGLEQNKIISAVNAYESFLRDEELPISYYQSMYPEREDAVLVYTNISESGINIDTLYSLVFPKGINYCKMKIALDALTELSLIKYDYSTRKVKRVKAEKRADLSSAPILVKLREKIGG